MITRTFFGKNRAATKAQQSKETVRGNEERKKANYDSSQEENARLSKLQKKTDAYDPSTDEYLSSENELSEENENKDRGGRMTLEQLDKLVDTSSQAYQQQDDVCLRSNLQPRSYQTIFGQIPSTAFLQSQPRNAALFFKKKEPTSAVNEELTIKIREQKENHRQIKKEIEETAKVKGTVVELRKPAAGRIGNILHRQGERVLKANLTNNRRVDLTVSMAHHEVGTHYTEEVEHAEANIVVDYAMGTPERDAFSINSWDDPRICLNPHFVEFICEQFPAPNPVQRRAVPCILTGQQLMCETPTGSGKTAAFLIPAIQTALNAKARYKMEKLYVIVLSNTNNLLIQTFDVAKKLLHYDVRHKLSPLGLRILPCFSAGIDRVGQYEGLSEICIATTGKLLDAIANKTVDLTYVELLILDEADKMANNDFGPQIAQIYYKILEQKQFYLLNDCTDDDPRLQVQVACFSATFERNGGAIVLNEYFQAIFRSTPPTHIYMKGGNLIEQRIVRLAMADYRQLNPLEFSFWQRRYLLLHFLDQDLKRQNLEKDADFFSNRTLVFVEMRKSCIFWTAYLRLRGYKFSMVSGDLTHRQVQEVLQELDSGHIQGVVTTNKMARGADIQGIEHVIILEMSNDFNDYMHRIGRTGRIGHAGRSTLVFDPAVDYKHAESLYKCLAERKQKIPRWLHDVVINSQEFKAIMSNRKRELEMQEQWEMERRQVDMSADKAEEELCPILQLDGPPPNEMLDPYSPEAFLGYEEGGKEEGIHPYGLEDDEDETDTEDSCEERHIPPDESYYVNY